ncbi:MAG TPA: hypothetical protein ENK54_08635 [Thiotrichales bacterium]|nr:hypothetical protein [Thiotrichales bacterium]
MPIHHQPGAERPALMTLPEASGLFADAVLTDEGRNLLFLSVWGRDTAIQEFRARLSLPVREGGLDRFRMEGEAGDLFVQVGNPDRLIGESGRAPSHSIFGSLVHLWLYDRLAVAPDRANRRALMLHRPEEAENPVGQASIRRRLWTLVADTCHVPLLSHWQETALGAFEAAGWIKTLPGIGVSAHLVDLGDDEVEDLVTRLIRGGRLAATG